MFVNKCNSCNYSTPETQDYYCPVCSDMNVRPRKFVKLERDVLVK